MKEITTCTSLPKIFQQEVSEINSFEKPKYTTPKNAQILGSYILTNKSIKIVKSKKHRKCESVSNNNSSNCFVVNIQSNTATE
jgi:UTP-glucose-1-phosphate uridylyltransferase